LFLKKANERLGELEYPAVEAIARMLEPPDPTLKSSTTSSRAMALWLT
jgi:hypothetical protein